MKTYTEQIPSTQILITIDDEEQINLRDFGYLSDEELDNKEAIANALHSVIADLWKMIVNK